MIVSACASPRSVARGVHDVVPDVLPRKSESLEACAGHTTR